MAKCLPGYSASIFNCESGLYLCVDTINKFFKNETCFEVVKDMYAPVHRALEGKKTERQ